MSLEFSSQKHFTDTPPLGRGLIDPQYYLRVCERFVPVEKLDEARTLLVSLKTNIYLYKVDLNLLRLRGIKKFLLFPQVKSIYDQYQLLLGYLEKAQNHYSQLKSWLELDPVVDKELDLE